MTPRRRPGTGTDTLPHNPEAERSVLGAILVDNRALDKVVGVIEPESFYNPGHRAIYRAMLHLSEQRVNIDLVTLVDAIERAGNMEVCGGVAAVAAIGDGVPRSTNVQYYAGIVWEKALLRAIINTANGLITDAYAAETPAEDLLSEADRTFLALRHGHGSDIAGPRQAAAEVFKSLEERVQNKGKLVGIDTGWTSINDLTSGWRDTHLTVVGARPSIGKSAFLFNTALAAAKSGAPALICTFEMDRREVWTRMVSTLSQVPALRLDTGHMGSRDYAHVAHAIEQLGTLPIYISDEPRQTMSQIRATCRRMQSEHKIRFVGIDYVQLIPGSVARKSATRAEELSDISRRAKELAVELRVPVLLLSQLRRLDGKASERKPRMDDLRESGSLEQDANDVVLLHRADHRKGGYTEAIFEKQRSGPTGTAGLEYVRDTVTFIDAPEEPEPDPAATKKTRSKPRPLRFDRDEASE